MIAEPLQSAPIGILVATGVSHPDPAAIPAPLAHDALGLPALLLPVLGKSMLQRALEILIQRGCREIHVLLGEDATPVREALEDGQRWGCVLHYHYQHHDETIARLMMRIGVPAEAGLWMADAACLPLDALPDGEDDAMYCHEMLGQRRWSGWCRIAARKLAAMEWPMSGIGQRLLSNGMSSVAGRVLNAADLPGWHRGCLDLLASEAVQDGFRPGKDSMVHPRARILPPVWIAENVRIEADCIIGPEAVIGAGSIIGKDTHLRHSIVLPDTFVGEHLDLADCIVRGNRLANIGIGSLTDIRDRRVLAGPGSALTAIPLRTRVAAALMKLVLYPAHVLASRRLRLKTPAGNGPDRRIQEREHWLNHFTREFYPGLTGVMHGHAALVGPQARSAGAIAALAAPWQRLYHEHHTGLLQEALFNNDSDRHADDFFASDALAAMQQQDAAANRALLRRYLGRVMHELGL